MTGRRGFSPAVRRRRLGAELRRYREQAGFTIEQVAEHMRCSTSKISRLETGQIGSSPNDIRELLTLFRVGEPTLCELVEVAKETRQRGWWQRHGTVLTSDFVAFEQAASLIRSYEAQCVPGLLQTEEYARHLLAGAQHLLVDGDEDEALLENRLHVRMRRRSLLTQDDPLQLWCVIDESALLRPVGGATVMRGQIDYLITMSEKDNVTIQVLPLRVGAHPGMDGSFAILRFSHESDPDAVYVTTATGGAFLEKPEHVQRHVRVFEQLTSVALTPQDSSRFMLSLWKEGR
ncbi:MAG: helix-turn-helix domain-containing protein [Micromonosporaceae bacterium]|nr:helix-turn-helix domain-containing protein [Micromonosporaceae bacterium]